MHDLLIRGHVVTPRGVLRNGAVAKVFHLWPRKGQLALGADADVAIFDPAAEWTLDEAALHSVAGWSPYHGWPVQGRLTKTLVRGRVVWDGQQVSAEAGFGRFIPPVR